jgi:hypothetical protein
MFALLGSLYYLSDTLGLRIDRRLSVRLYFSSLARSLAKDPSLWSEPVPQSGPSVPHRELTAWVTQALENRPAKVVQLPPPNQVIFGDASNLGFAGIIVTRDAASDFHTELFARRWGSRERGTLDFRQSCVSESEAAVRLFDAAAKLHTGSTATYVTDHEAFTLAALRGHSISPVYNTRISRILDRHPNARFIFQPGDTNLADKYSRFVAKELTPEDREAAIGEARRLLDGCDVGRGVGVGRLCGVVVRRIEG